MSQAKLYSSVLPKVAVQRSYLVSEDRLKAIAQFESLEDLAAELRETTYGDKLAEVRLPYTAKKFERVFRENLIEVSCKIVRNSPEEICQFLQACILKFERENIKTILRAASAGMSYDEIVRKIYMSVEEFLKNRDVIAKAAMGIDVKSVVDALKGTIYGPLLVMGLRKYEETGSTKFFDILLDRMFYENLGEAFKNLSKKEQKHSFFYVSTETDAFDLCIILRAKILNYDPHWIRMAISRNFYKIAEGLIEALLMADNFESALNIVKQSYYNSFFVKAETPEETVFMAEKAFRKALIDHAKKTRIGDPFNVGTVVGFMMQKEVETYNLSAMSLGIEYGWKSDDILRLLLL